MFVQFNLFSVVRVLLCNKICCLKHKLYPNKHGGPVNLFSKWNVKGINILNCNGYFRNSGKFESTVKKWFQLLRTTPLRFLENRQQKPNQNTYILKPFISYFNSNMYHHLEYTQFLRNQNKEEQSISLSKIHLVFGQFSSPTSIFIKWILWLFYAWEFYRHHWRREKLSFGNFMCLIKSH